MRLFTQHPKKLLTAAITTAIISSMTSTVYAEDELEAIDVISSTPVHGVGLPKEQVPVNVQTATDKDVDNTQTLALSDHMRR